VVDFGLGTSFFFARERLFDGFFKKEEEKSNEYMDNKQQTTKQPLKKQPTTNNKQPIKNNRYSPVQ